jgi:hypothetical protein
LASNSQTDPAAKAETRQQQWDAGELAREKIQRRAHVSLLTTSSIVRPGAHPSASKIESQHRQAQSIQRFRRLINHLVVHRAAEKRVRMANDRSHRWSRYALWLPQDRFEPPGRALKKQISRFVSFNQKVS